jgi:DNA-binding response OmpR family regulator
MVGEHQTEWNLPNHQPRETVRVLVVDDHPEIARSSALLLQLAGFEVLTAYTGRDALKLVAEFHPHVALLDIGLPDLDGYEVARRLRADRTLRMMTLIAITAYGAEEDRRLGLAAGFNHFLVKPVSFPALLSLIGSARHPTLDSASASI